MASVWLGLDVRDGRAVAIKRMRPQLAALPESHAAFFDEGQLGLRLRHAHLIRTFEVGEASTAYGPERYLVLELLRGRPLIDILRIAAKRGLPVPVPVALRIVADAARGLHHAHTVDDEGRPLGVVHRDVSPHNVFVCLDGSSKVLDFGVAKANEQSHETQNGAIKGKIAYLAPEQLRGHTPDARIDVFALGVVLHEMLRGKPLFRGENDAETLYRVLNGPIPGPSETREDVPEAVDAIVLRALHRDRERRLPSCAAFADSIEAVAAVHGLVLSSTEVARYAGTLFPDDGAMAAEEQALCDRTWATIEAERATTLAGVAAPAAASLDLRRRPSRAALASLLIGGTALAAMSGAHLAWSPAAVDPPLPIASPAPTPSRPPAPPTRVELEAPAAPPIRAASPGQRRHLVTRKPNDCGVYFSLTKSKTTVVCDPPARDRR